VLMTSILAVDRQHSSLDLLRGRGYSQQRVKSMMTSPKNNTK